MQHWTNDCMCSTSWEYAQTRQHWGERLGSREHVYRTCCTETQPPFYHQNMSVHQKKGERKRRQKLIENYSEESNIHGWKHPTLKKPEPFSIEGQMPIDGCTLCKNTSKMLISFPILKIQSSTQSWQSFGNSRYTRTTFIPADSAILIVSVPCVHRSIPLRRLRRLLAGWPT